MDTPAGPHPPGSRRVTTGFMSLGPPRRRQVAAVVVKRLVARRARLQALGSMYSLARDAWNAKVWLWDWGRRGTWITARVFSLL
jgi:hypothetical protein